MNKKKPLWLRMKQRYLNRRARLLDTIGICSGCGWRPHRGEWCCETCYREISY